MTFFAILNGNMPKNYLFGVFLKYSCTVFAHRVGLGRRKFEN